MKITKSKLKEIIKEELELFYEKLMDKEETTVTTDEDPVAYLRRRPTIADIAPREQPASEINLPAQQSWLAPAADPKASDRLTYADASAAVKKKNPVNVKFLKGGGLLAKVDFAKLEENT